eukprot:CAMPEP_0206303226 /NCGR_PEP_ID=MMETSP0106_2-20121207/9126_1 /ASSEMBLY_ACC=CAM_ASM_000206 /TAXON_ID=81532 /ORGANISM="Acanthoeca-like sp., Strain 10tr" /LENGTH=1719 /DNA_ID=CAMNT_0053734011 /DNA_START=177 /DNA_END=5336 /DNA_ORIENTATION=-
MASADGGRPPGQKQNGSAVALQSSTSASRRLATVLDRVSMIKGLVRTGKLKSDQASLRQHWMPDSNSKDCYDCGKAFTTFRRRHHCRVCGQIFCWKCSSEVIAGALLGYNGELRCCNYCSQVIRESESNTQRKSTVRKSGESVAAKELRQNSLHHPEPATSTTLPEATPRTPTAGSVGVALPRKSMVESAFSRLGFSGRSGVLPDDQLKIVVTKLASAIADGSLDVGPHRDRMVTHDESFVASDFVDWFVGVQHLRAQRSGAIAIGQQLLDAKYFQHVRGEETTFRDDYVLFKPMPSIFTAVSGGDGARLAHEADGDPAWLDEEGHVSSPVALNLLGRRNSPPLTTVTEDQASPERALPSPETRRTATPTHLRVRERLPSQTFKLQRPSSVVSREMAVDGVADGTQAFDAEDTALPMASLVHVRLFVEQALQRQELSLDWLGVLLPLIEKAIRHIRPNVRLGDAMDIRRYFRVKVITGGEHSDCRYFSGASFVKNVTSKKMSKEIRQPAVLLMKFAIEYERVENKYSSLDAVLLQEEEYLQSIVAKILALRPSVVLVGRSVARIAQDLLRDAGVALVVNVKPTAMEYVARCTKGVVLRSINELNFEPTLGTCDVFRVRDVITAEQKVRSFVCLEGCDPALGGTIFLRGSSNEDELKAVRVVLGFGVYVAHSLRLEARFLQNEYTATVDGSKSLIQKPDKGRKAFALALRRVALSTSPGVTPTLPYLYTERGAGSPVRYLVPEEFLWYRMVGSDDASPQPHDGLEDALLAKNHQEIDVLFACMDSTGFPCDNPRIIKMAFYGVNDLTLGSFLEMYCFEQQQKCCSNPHCGVEDTPMRSFTHRNSRVLVHIETLPQALSVSADEQRQIFMWSRCKTCDAETPLTKMTDDSWGLSLAKYLELTCNGENYRIVGEHACKTCGSGKSAHWNYYRNFCRGDKIVCFEHQAIEIPELVVPDSKICFERYVASQSELATKLADSLEAAEQLFGEIEHRLLAAVAELEMTTPPGEGNVQGKRVLKDMSVRQQQDYEAIAKGLEQTDRAIAAAFAKLSENGGAAEVDFPVAVALEGLVYDQNQAISNATCLWNQRMASQAALFSSTSRAKSVMAPSRTTSVGHSSRDKDKQRSGSESRSSGAGDSHPNLFEGGATDAVGEGVHGGESKSNSLSADTGSLAVPDSHAAIKDRHNPLIRSVSGILKPGVGDGDGAAAAATTAHTIEALLESPHGTTSKRVDEDTAQEKEKKSIMKRFTEVIQSASNTSFEPLRNPLLEHLHFCGPRNVIGVEVRIEEPSSIIAYALATKEYDMWISRAAGGAAAENAHEEAGATAAPAPPCGAMGGAALSPSSTLETGGCDNDLQKQPLSPESIQSGMGVGTAASPTTNFDGEPNCQHFKLELVDRGTKFYCKVFYANEFRGLRRQLHGLGDEGERRFIKSLSRCMRWDPHGGKSKASFSKMHDDRFILKEMSRPEAQSSLEFMPEYIRYTSEAHRTNKPTVLAQILGIFCIGFKTPNGIAMRRHVLVIENLHAGRQLSITFDLKGSMRSRYAHRTGKRGDVLLDENLLEYICDRPLYLRKHCKWVMETAIENDTTFLSNNGVMDYSLLLGIDDEQKVLVVGIIDYIRTFTWDKRLEMYVKRTGILGGHGNLPTVISPKMYKERFNDQMDKYFLCVPDRWHHLSTFNAARVANGRDGGKDGAGVAKRSGLSGGVAALGHADPGRPLKHTDE